MPSHCGCDLRRLIDDLVRAEDRVAQHDRLAHVAGAGLDVGAFLGLAGLRHEIDDRLYGDAARDLARVVAAHAVREHPQADFRLRADRVLVVIPNLADVRDFDVH